VNYVVTVKWEGKLGVTHKSKRHRRLYDDSFVASHRLSNVSKGHIQLLVTTFDNTAVDVESDFSSFASFAVD
jgi:hypothetical protein